MWELSLSPGSKEFHIRDDELQRRYTVLQQPDYDYRDPYWWFYYCDEHDHPAGGSAFMPINGWTQRWEEMQPGDQQTISFRFHRWQKSTVTVAAQDNGLFVQPDNNSCPDGFIVDYAAIPLIVEALRRSGIYLLPPKVHAASAITSSLPQTLFGQRH